MPDLSPIEINPIPVSRCEALSNHIMKIPDRLYACLKPIDMNQSRKVLNAMGGPEGVKRGAEINPDFIFGFEPWEKLAKEGRENGGIEYFANLNLVDEKIAPDSEVKEGWERLSPIGVLPETPSGKIGTIHTHSGESFFSTLDFITFLAGKDVAMAMVNSAGDISMMVKTQDISLNDKGPIFIEFMKQRLGIITRRKKVETEEEIYQRAREQIRFILDSANQLGIIVTRKEKEMDKFKIAK